MEARRTRIVCTVGPATDSQDGVDRLVEAGMDVARLNYSHGTPDDHARRFAWIRRAGERAGRAVAVLQDLPGPKIRTGTDGPAAVSAGDALDLVEGPSGDGRALAVDYRGLAEDLREGDRILLADGKVELRVEGCHGDRVRTRVVHGAELRDRMGVNLPAERVRLRAPTDQDARHLEHGLELGVDYVALSFVRGADDLRRLRTLCEERGRPTPLVAKVETPEAVRGLDEVVRAADAVMVARGDLGVELAPERVPVVQRGILEACRRARAPAIVATEMLQSMVQAPRPTRAEASDVASAVFAGADAVMLSAETATGAHPHAACAMMDRIIREAEQSRFYAPAGSEPGGGTPEAIARAACRVAEEVGAAAVVALTHSGLTARLVSMARPRVRVIGVSHDDATLRRLALFWGVETLGTEPVDAPERLAHRIGARLVREGLVPDGASFVLVHGSPVGEGGSTNAVRVDVAEA